MRIPTSITLLTVFCLISCAPEQAPAPTATPATAAAIAPTPVPASPPIRIDLSEWYDEGLGEELRRRLEGARGSAAPLIVDLTFSKVRGDVLAPLQGLENLREVLGIDVTDHELTYLRDLPNLESVSLSGEVTAAGLLQLRASRKLRLLYFSETQPPLDDAAIEQIVATWPELESLGVEQSQISDRGLAHIGRLTQLQYLNVNRTPITDEGLKSLVGLSRLATLHISQTQITDRGMPHLGKLTSLEKLDLNSTGIGDDGLRELHELTQLRSIYFVGTNVTDAGLEHLKPLKTIQFVGPNAHNTTAAIEALKEALPLYKANKAG